MLKIKILAVILVIIGAGWFVRQHHQDTLKQKAASAIASARAAAQKVINENNSHCAGNELDQEVVVSIARQHLWACEGTKSVYDSPVITGMEMYAADLTPPGTYKIYDKLTDQDLKGSDSTGSWDDPVAYWMPFLSNKYGIYGFHDANWRKDADFGHIDINAPFSTTAASASHGCVEMPSNAMKWLYDWSSVGTTVVINS